MHAFDLGLHERQQAQGGFRIGGGIGSNGLDGDLGHADLLLALANQFLDVGHLIAQARKGQILEAEIVGGRIHQKFGDHRIEGDGGHHQAMTNQNNVIIFGVMSDLGNTGVG